MELVPIAEREKVRRQSMELAPICRTFRLSECRTSLLVLPSVRKVDEVNVRNEDKVNFSIKREQRELVHSAELFN